MSASKGPQSRMPAVELLQERTIDTETDVARCSQCGDDKPVTDFNLASRSQSGRRSECRACQSRYNRQFKSRKPLYNIWNLMMQRCYNPRHPPYRHYGARGIRVCSRWHSFEAFAVDMSPRPSPEHSIDRIDFNGDYCPENCRWSLQQQQVLNLRSNRLVEIDGISKPLAEWVRINRLPKSTVDARIYRYGWAAKAAVTTPVRSKRGRV